MRANLVFNWAISSYFGWGIYGINLALHWARDPEVRPLCSAEVNPERILLDPLRRQLVELVIKDSAGLLDKLRQGAGQIITSDLNVMTALGNQLATVPSAFKTRLRGAASIGVVFLEDTNIDAGTRERAREFDLIVAGSSWGRDTLTACGIAPVECVMQGVDTTLFHPAPRSGLFRNRFVVFSGGKLEFRKGQDLVLLGFRAFAERHPEAFLVTAWHAPWSAVARYPFAEGRVPPMSFTANGRPDVAAWVAKSGVKPQNFMDLGPLPNEQMARIYREADVALFPNRCEAGTNLVAMECMACGVPTILAANTGQLDLIAGENCYALGRQIAVEPRADVGTEGWGESDVEEIVECLERAYADRTDAARRGALGAAHLGKLDWAAQTAALKRSIRPYLKAPAGR